MFPSSIEHTTVHEFQNSSQLNSSDRSLAWTFNTLMKLGKPSRCQTSLKRVCVCACITSIPPMQCRPRFGRPITVWQPVPNGPGLAVGEARFARQSGGQQPLARAPVTARLAPAACLHPRELWTAGTGPPLCPRANQSSRIALPLLALAHCPTVHAHRSSFRAHRPAVHPSIPSCLRRAQLCFVVPAYGVEERQLALPAS